MSTEPDQPRDDPIDRRVFYPLLLVGAGCVLWGVRSLDQTHVAPRGFVTWFLGALVLHDAILAPFVVIAGRLLARGVREPWRRAVQLAAIVGGAILLFSVPALFGDGRDPRDPSRLPNDYGRNVAIVLGAVAVVAVSIAVIGRWRRRP